MTQCVVFGSICSRLVRSFFPSHATCRTLVKTILAIWLTGAMLAAANCGPPPSVEQPAETSSLPEFTPSEAVLFDDTISQVVFSAELEEADGSGDPKLAPRVARADSVMPVKVSTVISDTDGMTSFYQLVLVPNGQPFAGASVEEPMTIVVSRLSPSYPLVRSEDASLVGRALIIFFRRFSVDGEVQVHWHIVLDSKRMRAAISRARTQQRTGS